MKLLQYMLFRFLEWKKTDLQESQPLLAATFFITTLLWFNLISVVFTIEWITGSRWASAWDPSRRDLTLLVGFLSIAAAVHFAWIRNSRYEMIIEKFSSETKQERRVGSIVFWTYLLLTGLLPIAIVVAHNISAN